MWGPPITQLEFILTHAMWDMLVTVWVFDKNQGKTAVLTRNTAQAKYEVLYQK